MKRKNQGAIITGVMLIGMGIFFLTAQAFPTLYTQIDFARLWPLIPLLVGVVLFVNGLFGSAELLVPGTVVSGVGSILFYQNSTDSWGQWQLWLLIPALAGIGTILYQLREGKQLNHALRAGGGPFVVGLVLYFVFTGLPSGLFWPIIFVAIGVMILFQGRIAK